MTYTIAVHHKGKWLFDTNESRPQLVHGTVHDNADTEAAVHEMLSAHLSAKKYDLALAEKTDHTYLFIADVSAFLSDIPSFLGAYEVKALPLLSPADAENFDRAMAFIASCRRATESLVGKEVDIIMDRPVGTRHPKHPDIIYPINYGYIDGMLSADGEGIDVYVLGIHEPLEVFHGKIIAVIRREDDIEDKLAAAPIGMDFTKQEIAESVRFQEQFYRSSIDKL